MVRMNKSIQFIRTSTEKFDNKLSIKELHETNKSVFIPRKNEIQEERTISKSLGFKKSFSFNYKSFLEMIKSKKDGKLLRLKLFCSQIATNKIFIYCTYINLLMNSIVLMSESIENSIRDRILFGNILINLF